MTNDRPDSSDAPKARSPLVRDSPLVELAFLFLKLGTIAFGGPAAHIAMMEDEIVTRRGWLTREKFLDLLGATNLIPGPNSTEMAIHVGYQRAGWPGLIVAGSCFILPAALIVGAIAWGYVRFGKLPQAEALLYGMKPIIIAIVLQALWRFLREELKTWRLALVAVVCAALSLMGVNELVLLLGSAVMLAAVRWFTTSAKNDLPLIALITSEPLRGVVQALQAGVAVMPFSLWSLLLFFLKIGSVLFGSGYVLLAFLRADLVERWGWLTEAQLIDSIAVGQLTPGPVFTTATFIGYLLGGVKGSVVATIGIFLPAFFFVGISGPLVPRIRKSPILGSALDGVIAASLALMAVVTFQLGKAALIDVPTVVLFLVGFGLLMLLRLNSAWLILIGAVAGLVLNSFK
ncbi:MAG: chromate transporter [Blastocatellia bacterium AA13]|nr:MAG: chromate transporter [Blastocatellia bacterium AA13]